MASRSNVGEYVSLTQPISIRKNILETAIRCALILKYFENYKGIRKDKIEKINKIRTVMRRIIREVNALNMVLPAMKGEGESPTKTEKKQIKRRVIRKEGIESDIEDIRKKLSELGV